MHLLLFILIALSSSTQVTYNSTILINIGQAHLSPLARQFHNYQHSFISSFVHIPNSYAVPLCSIRTIQPSYLLKLSELSYNLSKPPLLKQTIITDITELASLRVLIDAIEFQQVIVALFEAGEIIVFSVDQNGLIKEMNRFNLKIQNNIQYGNFFIFNKQLFFASSHLFTQIFINGSTKTLSMLTPNIQQAQVFQDHLVISEGLQGLSIYSWNSSNISFSLLGSKQLYFQNNNYLVNISVDEAQLVGDQIYILDEQQGLFLISYGSILKQASHVKVNKAIMLAGGCSNLIVSYLSLFLSCPELVRIDRLSQNLMNIAYNSFSPRSLKLQNNRIILEGQHYISIYDLRGRKIQETPLLIQSEKSFLLSSNHLITFGSNSVQVSSINTQVQGLACLANQPENEGIYSLIVQTEGICSESLNNKSISSNETFCSSDTVFMLKISNPNKQSNSYEMLLITLLIFFAIITLGVLGIKHCLIRRNYIKLTEQDNRNKEEYGSTMKLEAKKGEKFSSQ